MSLGIGLMGTGELGHGEEKQRVWVETGDRCDGETCGSAFLIASVVLAK